MSQKPVSQKPVSQKPLSQKPVSQKRSLLQGLYVISVAAELAGVHPQTLRIYERKGLVEPQRTVGRSR
ncbi:MAG TPA: MerR family DNA-binding transcriptional regulator, partial [Acidimicrobiales bacterium]